VVDRWKPLRHNPLYHLYYLYHLYIYIYIGFLNKEAMALATCVRINTDMVVEVVEVVETSALYGFMVVTCCAGFLDRR